MPRKVTYHACKGIHLLRERRAAVPRLWLRDGLVWKYNDYDRALCGNLGYYYDSKVSSNPCPRTVTCKNCLRSIKAYRRKQTAK